MQSPGCPAPISPGAPHTLPKAVILGAFYLGLLSAVAFRALMVLDHFEPAWVRPVWYFGVCGYFLFFLYRWHISRKRKRTIEEHGLIDKLTTDSCLTVEDRAVLIYLLCSLRLSKEDLNYYAIFTLSVLAVGADLALTYW
jgi:hypothetical protein